ncbi:MAG: hypothetical protein B1H08_06560 [Candidatus Omnitrophica bacterium 4484_171]|nr:MAG: hypothetical protein B1H08_06560 [Candidatus Omnitrophica bacterium 4484_171]
MPKLKKELTLIDVFSVAVGAMISSGLFILPGIAYAQAGPAVIVSYFIAGLFAMTGMLSQAELVSAMPKAGGTYFYVTRSMGPAVGTVNGLITWFSLSLKSVFALVGMAAFVKLIVGINIHIIVFVLCAVFIIINLVGIKEAGRVQVVLVFFLLTALVFYIIRGIPAVKAANFEPFVKGGWRAIFSTAGFVFISYGGLLKVASIAEETKNPAYIAPRAMMFSMFSVGIIYFFVVFVATGVLGDKLALSASSLTPISDSAQVIMGRGGRIILDIAAVLAFISTANAGIMAASRYPLALSRDGLLGDFLSRVNKRFNTPHNAILFTGLLMMIVLLFKLKVLIEAASTVLILTYMFSCFSIIIMRESRIQNYKPRFCAPFYPFVQIIGILGFGFLLLEMGYEALFISIILIIGGFLVYWFYGRIRSNSEYALLHIIERITAKELTTNLLESELKEIIRERDEITKDRFDHIIESAAVLDIKDSLEVDELFKRIAGIVSKRLGLPYEDILSRLWGREKEGNTAITPTLAIPHIIIEGKHIFDIFLIRIKKGVYFSDSAENVHAVFVLVGTKDERNFHLRSLAAIAQIVQDADFDKRWQRARNENELKDLILLSERKR